MSEREIVPEISMSIPTKSQPLLAPQSDLLHFQGPLPAGLAQSSLACSHFLGSSKLEAVGLLLAADGAYKSIGLLDSLRFLML